MKFFRVLLLGLTVLLSGCFGRTEYSSGFLNSQELRKSEEERGMMKLKQTNILRLGVPAGKQPETLLLEQKIQSKGWKLRIIPCPEKRLTGLLRTGALDVSALPGANKELADKTGFYFLAPDLLILNRFLFQKLSQPQ